LKITGTDVFKVRHFSGVLTMLQLSILFLVIALIAGALGLFNTQFIASEIAWVLFVVFLILFVVSLVFGRRSPVP